jgi:hypothetical protein
MKKTILTLLVTISSLMSSAQYTETPFPKLSGLMGYTVGVDSSLIGQKNPVLDSLSQSNVKLGTPTSNLFGLEFGFPDKTHKNRGLVNTSVTLPQRITDEYYIIHYLAVGYSFLEDVKDEYLLSYGLGIPLPNGRLKGRMYLYFIEAYHYRPDVVVVDPTKNRDFRQRRVRVSYRTNKFELSSTYTLRHSVILGVSYSFKK